eukprot:gene42753-52241_t
MSRYKDPDRLALILCLKSFQYFPLNGQQVYAEISMQATIRAWLVHDKTFNRHIELTAPLH